MRITALLFPVLALCACVSRVPSASNPMPASSAALTQRAERLYRDAIVIDVHNDLPDRMSEGYNPDVRNPAGFGTRGGHTDYPRLLESGLTAVFLSAWVDAAYALETPDQSFARALVGIDSIQAFARRHPDKLVLATTAAHVRAAKAGGKIAILIGVEGGHAIEGSLDNLRQLHRRGTRYLTLTWNNGNTWAGSSIGVNGTSTGGLTPFGRDVVREMNRLGILVDISHVSEATFFDAVAASTEPVIASHSSARALNDHPRNLSDAQLRAIRDNGGVVNVNFFSRFVDPRFWAKFQEIEQKLTRLNAELATRYGADTVAARAEFRREQSRLNAELPVTPLSMLIDHIHHIATVAGVEHVGLGSDFDGVSALPEEMEDVTRLPAIARALLERGYDETAVRKILGGNMLRVMQRVIDRREAPDAR